MLRFVPVGAVKRVHGGRPTSRGLPPAAVGGRGPRGNGCRSPKRDSQGIDPLSGCGQSPPFSPRDDFVDSAASWSAEGYAPSFRRACQTVLEGQTVFSFNFPPRQTKIRRANSEALLPAGQTASNTHTGSAPCPRGARQRHSTRRRRQAPAIEPAAVCTRARRKRNAPQPVCPLLVGQTGVTPEPKAPSAGTAGRRETLS